MTDWLRASSADEEAGSDRHLRARLQQELDGHVSMVAEPEYVSRSHRENWLRHVLPISIIVFLAVFAATRFFALANQAEHVEYREKLSTSNIAKIAALSLPDAFSRKGEASRAMAARNILDTQFDSRFREIGFSPSKTLFVADAEGKIFAAVPSDDPMVGRSISEVVPNHSTLARFAERNGVTDITGPDGREYYASHMRIMGTTQDRQPSPLGTITVLGDRNHAFAPVRDRISLNVLLFMLTGAALVLLLYAYYFQASRGAEQNAIHAERSSRIETAFTRGRCGLWDWDLTRGRIYWSSSMHTMLGYDPSTRVMGFGEVVELMHPDDPSLYKVAEEIADGHMKVMDRTFRMRHADGHWVWLRTRAEVVEPKEGQLQLIGIAVDITEQRRMEERERTADQRLHDAIASTSEAFVLWDAEGKLVLCNAKFQKTYQLPDEHVRRGADIASIFAKAHPARTALITAQEHSGSDLASVFANRSFETKMPDGRWLQTNIRRTSDGGCVAVGADITDLKHQHQQVQQHEQRLIATVHELEKSRREAKDQADRNQLLAERLEVEKINAEEANIAKSEFLAAMSHELRTPLNAILGFSEVLTNKLFGDLGSPKYEEYSSDIHKSGQFLLEVINDILDMSKIEAGKWELEPEDTLVCGQVRDSLRVVELQAAAKDLEIIDEIEDGLMARLDPRAFKQVLLNLLSNAVKFNVDRGKIWVRAARLNGSVVIAIEDTGVGIPDDRQEMLGRPFFQVQNQMTRDHDGTGLGLAIARSLIELHGGSMDIASEVGSGTCITCILPSEVSGLAVTHNADLLEGAA
ncbi:MAG: ATP-binding protein [Pseudomonadota bacterium]